MQSKILSGMGSKKTIGLMIGLAFLPLLHALPARAQSTPTAPSGLTGIASSVSSILWIWSDNSSNESGFRILSGTANISGNLPANTTTWIQTNLSTNTQHGPYVVEAFNGFGTADSGASAPVYTLAAVPTGLSPSDLSSTSIFVGWYANGNPGGTLYNLFQSSGGPFVSITTTTATSFTSTGLLPATTYQYKVEAYNGDFTVTAFSSIASTMTWTASSGTAPAISTPSFPTGYINNPQPIFNWIGPSTASLTSGGSFYLQVSVNPNLSSPIINVTMPTVIISTSSNIYGNYTSSAPLSNNTTYYWRVSTIDNASGLQSPWSSILTFMTDFSSPTLANFRSFNSTGAAITETQINNLTTGVAVQMTVQDIGLSGLAVSTGTYSVSFTTTAGRIWTSLTSTLSGVSGTTAAQILSATGLNLAVSTNNIICAGISPCGATNQVIFTASDLAGNVSSAGPFAILVSTASSGTVPTAPSGLTGIASSVSSILWIWSDNSSNESGFRILSGTANISGDLPANTTFWLQTGLSANTQYGPYVIEAFNAYGTARSSATFQYTLAAIPAELVIASITPTSLLVSWSANGNPTGTSYKLHLSIDPRFASIAQTIDTTATYVFVSSLTSNTTYFIEVQAFNHNGIGTDFLTVTPVLTLLFNIQLTNTAVGGASNDVSITVPPGALFENYSVAINPNPLTAPQSSPTLPQTIIAANNALLNNGGNGSTGVIPGKLEEINAYSGAGQSIGQSLAAPVTVSIGFSQQNGIVTGSLPIRSKTLAVYSLNERDSLWVKLPGSSIDNINNVVSAHVSSLGVFTIMGQVDGDLSNAYAYPVPFQSSRGDSRITFTNLSQLGTIRIFTISGRLVRSLDITDGTGLLDWDVTNSRGEKVVSGVYFYVIDSGTAKATGKLVIIR